MTEDRDFKNVVRRRAEKTGESYQAARRQLEQQVRRAKGTARVDMIFRTPRGIVIGCTIEDGTIRRGSTAVVVVGGRPVHEATVEGIKNFQSDIPAASTGLQCGLLLDPPYPGPVAEAVLTLD